jgi:hypothetical protein
MYFIYSCFGFYLIQCTGILLETKISSRNQEIPHIPQHKKDNSRGYKKESIVRTLNKTKAAHAIPIIILYDPICYSRI